MFSKRSTKRLFPAGFLWGTATAPTQVDGGDEASDWAAFCQKPGVILDGSTSVTGCDHWNRYESDYTLMKSMSLNAYRLGVDWSRFQPGAQDAFSKEAMDHFRQMLASLKKKKIRPLLTLNHFAVPAWWLARGGWEREENIAAFLAFVEFIVSHAGDLVQEYITFNEPNVYALMGYMDGKWPPAESGFFGFLKAMKVQRNMVLAHFKATDMIREIHGRKFKSKALVGLAMHHRVMDPLDPKNPLDADRTAEADKRLNWIIPDCIHQGRLVSPLGHGEKAHDPAAWDFYGINYYSRNFIRFDWTKPQLLFIGDVVKEGLPRNELGWEIYPEGLTRLLAMIRARYGEMPIRVTENGLPGTDENARIAFTKAHLAALAKSMSQGAKVDGYYHWSFMDNFEWAEGYTARFGLVRVDFLTQKRTAGPAAEAYKKIAKTGRL